MSTSSKYYFTKQDLDDDDGIADALKLVVWPNLTCDTSDTILTIIVERKNRFNIQPNNFQLFRRLPLGKSSFNMVSTFRITPQKILAQNVSELDMSDSDGFSNRAPTWTYTKTTQNDSGTMDKLNRKNLLSFLTQMRCRWEAWHRYWGGFIPKVPWFYSIPKVHLQHVKTQNAQREFVGIMHQVTGNAVIPYTQRLHP